MRKVLAAVAICLMVGSSAFGAIDVHPEDGWQISRAAGQYNGWRGFTNNDVNSPWMASWGDADDWGTNVFADAVVTGYSRTEIQDAISQAVAAEGDWEAYFLVYPRNWTAAQAAVPVVGVFDMDNMDWASTAMNTRDVSSSSDDWTSGGTAYPSFELAVKQGGASMYEENLSWTQATFTSPIVHDLMRIDISKDLVNFYLNNASADGFFVSSSHGDSAIALHGGGQWGGTGGPLLEIVAVPEPATLALLAMSGLALIRRRRA